jgi:hypothetical protein
MAELTKVIPWSRVLVEKLIITQLVKKFPTFYGSQRFLTTFKRTGLISEPDESNPQLSTVFPQNPFL